MYVKEDEQTGVCRSVPGFSAGSLLRVPVKLMRVCMNLDEPRSVVLRPEQLRTVLHQPPPSRWMSQLRDPAPEPVCRWYPGGLPSRHTATPRLSTQQWSEERGCVARRRTGALVVSGGHDGELHGVRRRGAGAVPAPTRAAAGAGERAEAGDQEERERRRGAADSPWAPRREERRPELVGGHHY